MAFENFKMLKLTRQEQNYIYIWIYHTNEPLKESFDQQVIKILSTLLLKKVSVECTSTEIRS